MKLAGLETLDAIAAAGADFCALDLEHSTIGDSEAFGQIAYTRALGLPCLVRTPAIEPGAVDRWLDAGATGIQLADVASEGEALALVRSARFAPDGERGMSPVSATVSTVAARLPSFGRVSRASRCSSRRSSAT